MMMSSGSTWILVLTVLAPLCIGAYDGLNKVKLREEYLEEGLEYHESFETFHAIVEQAQENNPMFHRDLQKNPGFNGEIYSRCGVLFPCNEGLQCVGPPTQKFCLPVECIQTKVQEEVDALGLDGEYTTTLLANAGLTEDDIFNKTTIDLGENATEETAKTFLLMPGVEEKLRLAMDTSPITVARMDELARECTGGVEPNQIAGQPWCYLGFHIEISAGIKFIYQFLYSTQVEVSTSPLIVATWSNICIGAGPSAGFHTEFVVGWTFNAQNITDVAQNSVMFDVGGAFFASIGQSMGFTVDNCYFKIELTIGAGIGAGAGVTYCFVTGYSQVV